MKTIAEVFDVTIGRPVEYPDTVSIAELAQFTRFDKKSFPTLASAADAAIRESMAWEVFHNGDNYVDWREARIGFKDGSFILFRERKTR